MTGTPSITTVSVLLLVTIFATASADSLGPIRTCRCYESPITRSAITPHTSPLGPTRLCHCLEENAPPISQQRTTRIVNPTSNFNSNPRPVSAWQTARSVAANIIPRSTTSRWIYGCSASPGMYLHFAANDFAHLSLCDGRSYETGTGTNDQYLENGAGCGGFVIEVRNSRDATQAAVSVVYETTDTIYVGYGTGGTHPGNSYIVNAKADWKDGSCVGYEDSMYKTDAVSMDASGIGGGMQQLHGQYLADGITAKWPMNHDGQVLCVFLPNSACRY